MWTKYFKTPFVNISDIYIKDADYHVVCNFIADMDTASCDRIVLTINGKYKPKEKSIFTLSSNKERVLIDGIPILLMRGWGYLTGVGGCNLKSSDAVLVQNSLAEYICKQLNIWNEK